MTWVLLPDGRIKEWEGSAALGDVVGVAGQNGIVVGLGGAQGSPTEFPGTASEIRQVWANATRRATRLGRGDPAKSANHFTDHRDLVQKALNKKYEVTGNGEVEFLRDLSEQVSLGRLRAIGVGTLAKGQPLVYAFRGTVGNAQLTLFMHPNGNWQTIVRSGEGIDLRIQFVMRFDTPNPFVAPNQPVSPAVQKRVALETLEEFRDQLFRQVTFASGDHQIQLELATKSLAGFATNRLFNADPPPTLIWNNAFGRLTGAQTAIKAGDVKKAFADLILARKEYLAAAKQYYKWKDGIDGAGTKMQIAIGVVAIALIAAAVAAFAATAAAGGAAASGATAGAAEQTVFRIAESCRRADVVFRVVDTAGEAVERAAAQELELMIEELARMQAF